MKKTFTMRVTLLMADRFNPIDPSTQSSRFSIPIYFMWVISVSLSFASHSCIAEVIRIGGTGSAMPLIQKLADDYQKSHHETQFDIMSPPLGSGGGIRALIGGRLDLTVSSKLPAKDEQESMAQPLLWLRTPFVFAALDAKPGANLDFQQLADIYSLKVRVWPDGRPIRLVMRSINESDSVMVRSLSPNLDAAIKQTLEIKSIPVAENDLDNLQLLERLPGSFGTASFGLLLVTNSPLRPMRLNGVEPSVENVEAGRYPLSKTLSLLTAKKPSEATSEFIRFLSSKEVHRKVRVWGYQAVDR